MVTCANEHCEVEFEPRRGGRPQKYCCRKCHVRQQARNRYRDDPAYREYQAAYIEAWRERNPERIRAINRRSRTANRDKCNARTKRAQQMYLAKSRAYDRIVEVGDWWSEVKKALQYRTDIPEPPMASLEDIAV
jgi:hypothetical protein